MTLTSAGRQQAAALAEHLATERLDLVQTSPRERTSETARAIASRAGVKFETAKALDEIDFGDWQGRTFDDLSPDPHWQEWNANRSDARCPGGESMSEAVRRIARHLQTLARDHKGKRITLVSHADMLRGLVADLIGLPLDNMLRFEIAPASISRIEFSEAGGVLQSLNETGHLGHREET